MTEPATTPRRLAVAVAADVVALVLFAALGRNNHSSASSPLEIAAPFIVGAAAGWAIARGWRAPFALSTGIHVWWATVAVGMMLRWRVWDRGVQLSFVIVATLFTGLFLLGWRAVAGRVLRRSSAK
ncbi:MAG: DUF3054 domain-containing protein [Ilumatobacteraceae bacterium]